MFIGWIGIILYFMVEWCVRIGCLLKIFVIVMGTTVFVVGTSIFDAFSFILVVKDGFVDMVVVNVVGLNVFDIWLGLGFLWLLYFLW